VDVAYWPFMGEGRTPGGGQVACGGGAGGDASEGCDSGGGAPEALGGPRLLRITFRLRKLMVDGSG